MRMKLGLLSALIGGVAVAALVAPGAAFAEKVRIAHSTWVGYGPLYIAQDKGFFKKNGVDVDLVVMEDPKERFPTMMADKIQMIASTVDTALLYLKGQDWRATHGEGRLRQMAESSVLVSQPPRVSRSGSVPPSAQRTKARGEPDARASAEIDRVLDKISASGVDSLTPAERKFLTEFSRRKRTPPKA